MIDSVHCRPAGHDIESCDECVTELLAPFKAREAADEAAVKALRERLDSCSRYAADLQQIIEDLCHERPVREPKTTARHHFEMAQSFHLNRAMGKR